MNVSFTKEMFMPEMARGGKAAPKGPGRLTGRHSLLDKSGKQSPILKNFMSNRMHRKIMISEAVSQSEDMLPVGLPASLGNRETEQIGTNEQFRLNELNNASNEALGPEDSSTVKTPLNMAFKSRTKAKNRMTTCTIGSNSDVSTTVMAQSQAANRANKMSSINPHNFAELGAVLINDTPRSGGFEFRTNAMTRSRQQQQQ